MDPAVDAVVEKDSAAGSTRNTKSSCECRTHSVSKCSTSMWHIECAQSDTIRGGILSVCFHNCKVAVSSVLLF